MPIPVPVELVPGTPSGGFLASVGSLPDGWTRGIQFADDSCLLPVVMGECPTLDNLKPGQRVEAASTFMPVSVIEAVECTAMGDFDPERVAGAALDRTREFALARELLTGEASARDANPARGGNPSLVGSATNLSTAASLAAAVACLEQQMGAATGTSGGYLFAGLDMLVHLKDAGVIWRDGARWRTPSGKTVVSSAGFDGRAPGSDGPPSSGDPLYLYATAGVWAGVGQRAVFSDVDRSVNTVTSRVEDVALAAFTECSTFAIAASDVTAC